MLVKRLYLILGLLMAVFWAVGCSIGGNLMTDPYYEAFYEKARLIMTDGEKKIYGFLEDRESREEFIREFWKIRDPDPTTDENEAKIEFEKRVRFASIRFGWKAARSRTLAVEPTRSDRGWDTDMGMIYIILGAPDRVFFGDGSVLRQDDFEGDMGWRFKHGAREEVWLYDKYRLAVGFRGTDFAANAVSRGEIPIDPSLGDPASEYPSVSPVVPTRLSLELLSVLEDAKLNYINPAVGGDMGRGLRFKAVYDQGRILLRIPVLGVEFKEEGGKLLAAFRMKVNIYLDSKRLETFTEDRSVEETEESVRKKKTSSLESAIPWRKRESIFLTSSWRTSRPQRSGNTGKCSNGTRRQNRAFFWA